MPLEFNIKHKKYLPNLSEAWKRNLFFISLSQFITMIGMSSIVPFMPLYILDLGIKDMESAKLSSGLVFAGPYFISIVAVPFWGYLGDKYGRKLMIIRAVFGLTIAVFLMGFAQNVYQFFALRVFQGAVSGVIAAALAFTAANSPHERSGYSIGILQSSQSAGNIIGPLIGGLLSDFIGTRFTFIFVAVLIFISGLCVVFFVKENKNTLPNLKDITFTQNIRIAGHAKGIMYLLLLIVLSQAGIQFTNPIFPYFISQLGAPREFLSTITGLLLGVVGLMSIFFAPMWGRRNDKKDYHKTLFISTGIIGIAALLHVVVPNYLYLFPLRIIIGIFFAAVIPTLYSALNKTSTNENKGSIMGLASSANLFGSLIAFLSCGVVSSAFGMDTSFVVAGLLLLAVAALVKIRKH